ncbi:MAG: thioredoxin-disulfide reductase [Burkholderiales bacterium]|nr:thioredoxin-disulfide reductase [Anaerolineae bacterium]
MQKERVVIIGSGPAGLTAALYTGRAMLNPVVIAGSQLGGQVAITADVDNYPGFPEGVTGPELVQKMAEHAEKFGARIVMDEVTEVDFLHGSPFRVKTYEQEFLADSVIVTIGARARRLGIPGEEENIGTGTSYCGTCDGFFFRGMDITVVGGGDSAIEEAIFLTKFATSVNIVHRRDELRAGKQLQERAFRNPKIRFTWDSALEEIIATDDPTVSPKITAVRIKNLKTGAETTDATRGVFIFIGHDPNSEVFKGQLASNDSGYVLTDELMRTNVEGIFAAGEIQDEVWRQVATSVGQGTSAAMSAIQWLSAREGDLQPLGELSAEEVAATQPQASTN